LSSQGSSGLLLSRFPPRARSEVLGRLASGAPFDHVVEVLPGVELELATAGDEREEDRCVVRADLAASEEPVPAADRDETDRALDGIVVGAERRVVEEAAERDAVVPAVADRLRERRPRDE